MKSLLLFLLITAQTALAQSQPGQMYADIEGNRVTLWEIATRRICCAQFFSAVEVTGTEILWEQHNIGALCDCYCYYDIGTTIFNLPPGEYHVAVWMIWDCCPDLEENEYMGDFSFTVEEGPSGDLIFGPDLFQDCYEPQNLSPRTVPPAVVLEAAPNPFNPETVLNFQLPEETNVTLRIYDLQGNAVARLFSGRLAAGIHGLTWNGAHHPSGIYLAVLTVGDAPPLVKKLTLVR